ncbi:MAG: hypothetical protein EH225_07865, partial [Calditrichaeota bacterium]
MKRLWPTVCLLVLINFSVLFSQGMPRSNGLGFRLSFWRMAESEVLLRIRQQGLQQTVNMDGFGFWLQYYNRIRDNLSLTFDFGMISRIHFKSEALLDNNVDVNAILAFLPGIRYDLLSRRLNSKFQPYLDGGIGPYFQQTMTVQNYGINETVSTESKYDLGFFLGSGVNLAISNRFAFNFNLKYHFVNFAFEKDISGIEFGIGLSYMWGKLRDLFRVRQTTMVVHDIYPAYYQFYNTYPLAILSIENTAGFPIEVNVRSQVSPFSARIKESGFVTIDKGETKDIPV